MILALQPCTRDVDALTMDMHYKLTWLVLGGDPAVCSHRVEQLAEACNALGASDGVAHSSISHEAACWLRPRMQGCKVVYVRACVCVMIVCYPKVRARIVLSAGCYIDVSAHPPLRPRRRHVTSDDVPHPMTWV